MNLAEVEPMVSRIKDIYDSKLSIIGQIGGYGAGFIAWITETKEIFGVIGVVGGAILTCWAIFEKIRKEYTLWRRRRAKLRMKKAHR